MIRNLYEFELSGLKVVRGQFVRLGNQINNSIRFFNILEREIAVYLLLSYDRNSFVGQYPFISFGIFENGIHLVSLQVLFEGTVQSDSFPLFAKLVIYADGGTFVLKGDPRDSFGKGINMVGIIICYHRFCYRSQYIDKLLCLIVEHIHPSVVGLAPDIPIFRFRYLTDPVGIQNIAVFVRCLIVFECISVEFIQPVPGAEP